MSRRKRWQALRWVVVLILLKEEKLISKWGLKGQEVQQVENLEPWDWLDVQSIDNVDLEQGNPRLDGLECQRFLLE